MSNNNNPGVPGWGAPPPQQHPYNPMQQPQAPHPQYQQRPAGQQMPPQQMPPQQQYNPRQPQVAPQMPPQPQQQQYSPRPPQAGQVPPQVPPQQPPQQYQQRPQPPQPQLAPPQTAPIVPPQQQVPATTTITPPPSGGLAAPVAPAPTSGQTAPIPAAPNTATVSPVQTNKESKPREPRDEAANKVLVTRMADEETEDGRIRNREAMAKIRDAWVYKQVRGRVAEFTEYHQVSPWAGWNKQFSLLSSFVLFRVLIPNFFFTISPYFSTTTMIMQISI